MMLRDALRRHAQASSAMAPVSSSAMVEGSGTPTIVTRKPQSLE